MTTGKHDLYKDSDAEFGTLKVGTVYDTPGIVSLSNLPQGGTAVEMYCDGTYWIVSGVVLSTAVPVFS